MRRTGRELLAASPVSVWAAVAWLLALVGLWLRLATSDGTGSGTTRRGSCSRRGSRGRGSSGSRSAPRDRLGGGAEGLLLAAGPSGGDAPASTLVFSLLTLWAAWTTASALAGDVAGLLAVAILAFDPMSVPYAKVLRGAARRAPHVQDEGRAPRAARRPAGRHEAEECIGHRRPADQGVSMEEPAGEEPFDPWSHVEERDVVVPCGLAAKRSFTMFVRGASVTRMDHPPGVRPPRRPPNREVHATRSR